MNEQKRVIEPSVIDYQKLTVFSCVLGELISRALVTRIQNHSRIEKILCFIRRDL